MTFVSCVVDNSNFQSVQGVVTSLCTDYGWINESIFFNTDIISDNTPLNIGTNVLALVEENNGAHILKAIKVCLRFCRVSYSIACCCVAVIKCHDQRIATP